MIFFLKLRRGIALFTLISFCITTAVSDAYAVNGSQGAGVSVDKAPAPIAQLPTALTVPQELGQVEEVFDPAQKTVSRVIHIQDAHSNYEAQKSIAGLIEYLTKSGDSPLGGQSLVLMEGVFGEIDTTLLQAIPDENMKRNGVERLLKKGLISGPEYFQILSPKKGAAVLKGVEDKGAYLKNYQAFRALEEMRPKIALEIKLIETYLGNIQNRIYPKKLRELDRYRERFGSNAMDLAQYLGKLTSFSESGINKSRCPELYRLWELLQKKTADPAEVKRVRLGLDAHQIFRELALLESEVRSSYLTSPAQKDLDRYLSQFELFKKGSAVELVPEEAAEFGSKGQQLEVTALRKFVDGQLRPQAWPENSLIASTNGMISEFYKWAELRDRRLYENLLTAVKGVPEDTNILLVTGGYHTRGLSSLFRENSIGFTVIAPRIQKIEAEVTQKLYRENMGEWKFLSGSPPPNLSHGGRGVFSPSPLMGEGRGEGESATTAVLKAFDLGNESGQLLPLEARAKAAYERLEEVYQRPLTPEDVATIEQNYLKTIQGLSQTERQERIVFLDQVKKYVKASTGVLMTPVRAPGSPTIPAGSQKLDASVFAPAAGQSLGNVFIDAYDPKEYRIELFANEKPSGHYRYDNVTRKSSWDRDDNLVPSGLENNATDGALVRLPLEELESRVIAELGDDRDHLTTYSYNNLYSNDWFVAFDGRTQELYHARGEPYEKRYYSMLVVWKDGRVSSEELRFLRGHDGNRTKYQIFRALDQELATDLNGEIKFAVFGQRLVHNAEAVPLPELAAQFSDLFHLYRLPQFMDSTKKGPQAYGEVIGLRQINQGPIHPITPEDREVLKEILARDGYAEIDLTPYLTRYTLEHIKRYAFGIHGYKEVSGKIRSIRDLLVGQYFVKENILHVRLRPFPYPHNLLGITASGKVIAAVLTGDKTKEIGFTLPDVQRIVAEKQRIAGDPVRELFLLANSRDAYKRVGGAYRTSESSPNPYEKSTALIGFVRDITGRSLGAQEPEKISGEITRPETASATPRERLKGLEQDLKRKEKAFEVLRKENLKIFLNALAEGSVIGLAGFTLAAVAAEYKALDLSQVTFVVGTFAALGRVIWKIRNPERAFHAARMELDALRRHEWETRKEVLKPLFQEEDLEFGSLLIPRALEKVGQVQPLSETSLESRLGKILPKLKRFDGWVATGGYSYFDKEKGKLIEEAFGQVVGLINETLLDAALFVETKGESKQALRDMEASDLPALSASLDTFFRVSAQSLGSSPMDKIADLLGERPETNLYDLAHSLRMDIASPEFRKEVLGYLRTIPKVSLHEHTSGLIYPEYLLRYFLKYPEARRRFALVYLALNPDAYPDITRGPSAAPRTALDLQARPVDPADITLKDADRIFGEQVGFPNGTPEKSFEVSVERLKKFTTYKDNQLKYRNRFESWNRFESAFAYIKTVTDVKPAFRYKLIRQGIWKQFRKDGLRHLEITDYHSGSFDQLAQAIVKAESKIRKKGGDIDIALLKAFRKDQLETLLEDEKARGQILAAYEAYPTLDDVQEFILKQVTVSDQDRYGLTERTIKKEFEEAYEEIERQYKERLLASQAEGRAPPELDLRQSLIFAYEARKKAYQEFRTFEGELDRIETVHPEYRKRIVGISSIGDETRYINWINAPIIRRAKQIGLKVTSHVGERWLPGDYIPALKRVKRELELGIHRVAHATVLGLDFDRVKDVKLSWSQRQAAKKLQNEILDYIHHRMVHIELNPTSQIMFSPAYNEYKNHAALPFLKRELSVSINPDDSSVFDTGLSQEILEIWLAKPNLKFSQLNSTITEAGINRFYESTEEVIDRLTGERELVVEAQEKLNPPAAVVFGSARIPSTNPVYMMAFMMGQWMWNMGIVPRTGMGPSIMTFVLEGYIAARNRELGLSLEPGKFTVPHPIKTQGVRILLNFFEPASSFVEVGYSFSHFVFRKLALYSNSRAVIAFPGGFGTLDELFETWRLELPLILVDSKFWTPIMDALRESWTRAGLLGNIRTWPQMTDFLDYTKAPKALSHILEYHQGGYANKEDKAELKRKNAELRTGITKLSKLKLSIAVLGHPSLDSSELGTLRQLTEKLLKIGVPVRALNRGVIFNEIVTGAREMDREDLVQTVLFKAAKDNDWTPEELDLAKRFPKQSVLTEDDPNQRILGFFGVRGVVVLPGGVGTMARLWDLIVAMQTGKIRKRPIILIGRTFWEPILQAIRQQMEAFDPPLISPGDMHIVQVVDTEEELLEKFGFSVQGTTGPESRVQGQSLGSGDVRLQASDLRSETGEKFKGGGVFSSDSLSSTQSQQWRKPLLDLITPFPFNSLSSQSFFLSFMFVGYMMVARLTKSRKINANDAYVFDDGTGQLHTRSFQLLLIRSLKWIAQTLAAPLLTLGYTRIENDIKSKREMNSATFKGSENSLNNWVASAAANKSWAKVIELFATNSQRPRWFEESLFVITPTFFHLPYRNPSIKISQEIYDISQIYQNAPIAGKSLGDVSDEDLLKVMTHLMQLEEDYSPKEITGLQELASGFMGTESDKAARKADFERLKIELVRLHDEVLPSIRGLVAEARGKPTDTNSPGQNAQGKVNREVFITQAIDRLKELKASDHILKSQVADHISETRSLVAQMLGVSGQSLGGEAGKDARALKPIADDQKMALGIAIDLLNDMYQSPRGIRSTQMTGWGERVGHDFALRVIDLMEVINDPKKGETSEIGVALKRVNLTLKPYGIQILFKPTEEKAFSIQGKSSSPEPEARGKSSSPEPEARGKPTDTTSPGQDARGQSLGSETTQDLRGPDPELDAFIEALSDKNPRTRETAAKSISQKGSRAVKAVPALIKLLGDENHFARQAAAIALGSIGPQADEAAAPLARRLDWTNEHNVFVRRAATTALGQIRSDKREAVLALLKGLSDQNPYVRIAAANSLAGIPASWPAARERLKERLRNPALFEDVRQAFEQAFRKTDPSSPIPGPSAQTVERADGKPRDTNSPEPEARGKPTDTTSPGQSTQGKSLGEDQPKRTGRPVHISEIPLELFDDPMIRIAFASARLDYLSGKTDALLTGAYPELYTHLNDLDSGHKILSQVLDETKILINVLDQDVKADIRFFFSNTEEQAIYAYLLKRQTESLRQILDRIAKDPQAPLEARARLASSRGLLAPIVKSLDDLRTVFNSMLDEDGKGVLDRLEKADTPAKKAETVKALKLKSQELSDVLSLLWKRHGWDLRVKQKIWGLSTPRERQGALPAVISHFTEGDLRPGEQLMLLVEKGHVTDIRFGDTDFILERNEAGELGLRDLKGGKDFPFVAKEGLDPGPIRLQVELQKDPSNNSIFINGNDSDIKDSSASSWSFYVSDFGGGFVLLTREASEDDKTHVWFRGEVATLEAPGSMERLAGRKAVIEERLARGEGVEAAKGVLTVSILDHQAVQIPYKILELRGMGGRPEYVVVDQGTGHLLYHPTRPNVGIGLNPVSFNTYGSIADIDRRIKKLPPFVRLAFAESFESQGPKVSGQSLGEQDEGQKKIERHLRRPVWTKTLIIALSAYPSFFLGIPVAWVFVASKVGFKAFASLDDFVATIFIMVLASPAGGLLCAIATIIPVAAIVAIIPGYRPLVESIDPNILRKNIDYLIEQFPRLSPEKQHEVLMVLHRIREPKGISFLRKNYDVLKDPDDKQDFLLKEIAYASKERHLPSTLVFLNQLFYSNDYIVESAAHSALSEVMDPKVFEAKIRKKVEGQKEGDWSLLSSPVEYRPEEKVEAARRLIAQSDPRMIDLLMEQLRKVSANGAMRSDIGLDAGELARALASYAQKYPTEIDMDSVAEIVDAMSADLMKKIREIDEILPLVKKDPYYGYQKGIMKERWHNFQGGPSVEWEGAGYYAAGAFDYYPGKLAPILEGQKGRFQSILSSLSYGVWRSMGSQYRSLNGKIISLDQLSAARDAFSKDLDGSKTVFGNKMLNLAEIQRLNLSVPASFVIRPQVTESEVVELAGLIISRLEKLTAKRFGPEEDKFQLAVRSSPSVSMPGLLETVTDVGSREQLLDAINKVRGSWDSELAKQFRKEHAIPDTTGLPIIIQVMIRGDKNENSGSGVAFTRNGLTGKDEMTLKFMVRAKGAEVVQGSDRPLLSDSEFSRRFAAIIPELEKAKAVLEKHFRDPQEIEFVVEDGKLWFVQTRSITASPQVRAGWAVNFVDEGLIHPGELPGRFEKIFSKLLMKIKEGVETREISAGESVSAGAAFGPLVGNLKVAKEWIAKGKTPIIFYNKRSDEVNEAILTPGIGGMITSYEGHEANHESALARAYGVPMIDKANVRLMGTSRFAFSDAKAILKALLKEGELVLIDGESGKIFETKAPDPLEPDRIVIIQGMDFDFRAVKEGAVKAHAAKRYDELIILHEQMTQEFRDQIKAKAPQSPELLKLNFETNAVHELIYTKGKELGKTKPQVDQDIQKHAESYEAPGPSAGPISGKSLGDQGEGRKKIEVYLQQFQQKSKGPSPIEEVLLGVSFIGLMYVAGWPIIRWSIGAYRFGDTLMGALVLGAIGAIVAVLATGFLYALAAALSAGVTYLFAQLIKGAPPDLIQSVGREAVQENIEYLVDVWSSLPQEVKGEVIGVLGDLNDYGKIDDLLYWLEHPDPQIAGAAERSLRKLGITQEQIADRFLEILRSDSVPTGWRWEKIGEQTRKVLSGIRDPQRAKDLLGLLTHPNLQVAEIAEELLPQLGVSRKLITDHYLEILRLGGPTALRARDALVRFKDPRVVQHLEMALEHAARGEVGNPDIGQLLDQLDQLGADLFSIYGSFIVLLIASTIAEHPGEKIAALSVALKDLKRLGAEKTVYRESIVRFLDAEILNAEDKIAYGKEWLNQIEQKAYFVTGYNKEKPSTHSVAMNAGPPPETSWQSIYTFYKNDKDGRSYTTESLEEMASSFEGVVRDAEQRRDTLNRWKQTDWDPYYLEDRAIEGKVFDLDRILIRWRSAGSETDQLKAKFGSKALNLSVMHGLKLSVPPALVVPAKITESEISGFSNALIRQLEKLTAKRFGSEEDQFQLAVRSSPSVSMPGLLETVTDVSSQQELIDAIKKVRASWDSEQAKKFRKGKGISDEIGLPVIVQVMIRGDKNENSGSGVAVTRNVLDGKNEINVKFIARAKGAEVVQGSDKPLLSSSEFNRRFAPIIPELQQAKSILEKHFRDPQEIEFAVEDGKLWFVQTRNITASPQVLAKIAVDFANEGLIYPGELPPRFKKIFQKLLMKIKKGVETHKISSGVPVSAGAAFGPLVSSLKAAKEWIAKGKTPIVFYKIRSNEVNKTIMTPGIGGIITSYAGHDAKHESALARAYGVPMIDKVDIKRTSLPDRFRIFLPELIGAVMEGDMALMDGGTGKFFTTKASDPLEPDRLVSIQGTAFDFQAVMEAAVKAHAAKRYDELIILHEQMTQEFRDQIKAKAPQSPELLKLNFETNAVHELIFSKGQELGKTKAQVDQDIQKYAESRKAQGKPFDSAQGTPTDTTGPGQDARGKSLGEELSPNVKKILALKPDLETYPSMRSPQGKDYSKEIAALESLRYEIKDILTYPQSSRSRKQNLRNASATDLNGALSELEKMIGVMDAELTEKSSKSKIKSRAVSPGKAERTIGKPTDTPSPEPGAQGQSLGFRGQFQSLEERGREAQAKALVVRLSEKFLVLVKNKKAKAATFNDFTKRLSGAHITNTQKIDILKKLDALFDSGTIKNGKRFSKEYLNLLMTAQREFEGFDTAVDLPAIKLPEDKGASGKSLGAPSKISFSIPPEAVLATDPTLGTVADGHLLLNSLQSNEEKNELARQVTATEMSAFQIEDPKAAETLIPHWKDELKRSSDRMLLLIDPAGQVRGYLSFGADLTRKISLMKYFATYKDGAKGRGALLVDTYMKILKQKGVDRANWSVIEDAPGFYHRYLTPRMDYVTKGGIEFSADVRTFQDASEASKEWRAKNAEHLRFIQARERLVRDVLGKLRGVYVFRGAGEESEASIEILPDGTWRCLDGNKFYRFISPAKLQRTLTGDLTYDANAYLAEPAPNRVIVIPPSGLSKESPRESFAGRSSSPETATRGGTGGLMPPVRPADVDRLSGQSLGDSSQVNSRILASIPPESILATDPVLGSVVDKRLFYDGLRDKTVKDDLARQVAEIQVLTRRGVDPIIDAAATEYWKEELESRYGYTYLLIDPTGKAQGFLMASEITSDMYRMNRLAVRQDGVKGRGTFMMDTIFKMLRMRGVERVRWTPMDRSPGFYHRYLAPRMDYLTKGDDLFEVYLSTSREWAGPQAAWRVPNAEFLDKIKAREDRVRLAAESLQGGYVVVRGGKSPSILFTISPEGKWGNRNGAASYGGISSEALKLLLISELMYNPEAILKDAGAQQVLIAPSGLVKDIAPETRKEHGGVVLTGRSLGQASDDDLVSDAPSAVEIAKRINGQPIQMKAGEAYSFQAKNYPTSQDIFVTLKRKQDGAVSGAVAIMTMRSGALVLTSVNLEEVVFRAFSSPFDLTEKGIGSQFFRVLGKALPGGTKFQFVAGNLKTRDHLSTAYFVDSEDRLRRRSDNFLVVDGTNVRGMVSVWEVMSETLLGRLLINGGFGMFAFEGRSGAEGLKAVLKEKRDENGRIPSFLLTVWKMPDTAASFGQSLGSPSENIAKILQLKPDLEYFPSMRMPGAKDYSKDAEKWDSLRYEIMDIKKGRLDTNHRTKSRRAFLKNAVVTDLDTALKTLEASIRTWDTLRASGRSLGSSENALDNLTLFRLLAEEIESRDLQKAGWSVVWDDERMVGRIARYSRVQAQRFRRLTVELKEGGEMAFRSELLNKNKSSVLEAVVFVIRNKGSELLVAQYQHLGSPLADTYRSQARPLALALDSDHQIYALVPNDFHLKPVEMELSGSRSDIPFVSKMTQLRKELVMPVRFKFYSAAQKDPSYNLQILEVQDSLARLKDGSQLPRTTVDRIRKGLTALQFEDSDLFDELVTQAKFSRPGQVRPFSDQDAQMRIALYGFLEPNGRVKGEVVHVVRSAVRGSIIGSPYAEPGAEGASLGDQGRFLPKAVISPQEPSLGQSLGAQADLYQDLIALKASPAEQSFAVTMIHADALTEGMVLRGLIDRLNANPHEIVRAMWHGDILSETEVNKVRAQIQSQVMQAPERFQIIDMRREINSTKGMQAMLEGRVMSDLLLLARKLKLEPEIRTEQDLWPYLAVLADQTIIQALPKQHVKVIEFPAAGLPTDPNLREAARLKMIVLTTQLAALKGDWEALEKAMPNIFKRQGEFFQFTQGLLEKLAELSQSYLASLRTAAAA